VDKIADFEKTFFEFCEKEFPDIEHSIAKEKIISETTEDKLKQATEQFKEKFTA
jgi:F-type H+-transporting ATPase subunit alpha